MKKIIKADGRLTVYPDIDVVSSTAEDFREELSKLIRRNNSRELIIDLSDVEKIDSVGIGVFIAVYNSLKREGRDLVVTNASDHTYRFFKTMGLARRIRVIPCVSN